MGLQTREEVSAALQRINRVWLERRTDDLAPLFHPEITLVFPGFAGRVEGPRRSWPASPTFAGTRQSTSTGRPITRPT